MKPYYRQYDVSYGALIEFVHRLYKQLNEGKHHMAIGISQELSGIQTAVNALIAEQANPTTSVLTTGDQATLDAIAASLGAPTSTSTPATTTPVSTPTLTPAETVATS